MFFIKKQINSASSHDKSGKKPMKRKRIEEDEVTSSSDEEVTKQDETYESDDPDETAQAKKVRLAKAYLKEIEKEVLERENEEENVNKRLREDYLKSTGKLRTTIADRYKEADIENIKTLKCKEHRICITCIFVTNGDEFVFSGGKDGCIVKWDLKESNKVGSIPFIKKANVTEQITGHSKSILCITISSDNKFMAVGDETKDIQIWDPLKLTHINTLKGHRAAVTGVVFRRDTHTLYSCSKDRSVKVWSIDEMAYVETVYGHQDIITSIDALSKERAITSGGRDSSIRLWKIMEESQLIFNGPEGSLDAVRMVNEEIFISGGDDGQICVWSVNRKKPLCSVKEAHGNNWICSLATLVNTDLIASGSTDGFINLYKLSNKFRVIELLFKIPVKGFINSMHFTSDGKLLIVAVGPEHKLGRWEVFKSIKTSILVIPLKQSLLNDQN